MGKAFENAMLAHPRASTSDHWRVSLAPSNIVVLRVAQQGKTMENVVLAHPRASTYKPVMLQKNMRNKIDRSIAINNAQTLVL